MIWLNQALIANHIAALVEVLEYNGYEDDIQSMIERLSSNIGGTERYVDHVLEELDPDHPMHILWSVCVMIYGDYGSSPRFGWIYSAKKRDLLDCLQFAVENGFDRAEWESVTGDPD